MASGSSRRFGDASNDEIAAKRLKLNSDNTIKSNQKSANILREYLLEKQQDPSFETCVRMCVCVLKIVLRLVGQNAVQG
jgi:hypothetical protein